MEASIVRLQGMRIVALRHVGPYHEIGSSFDRLMAWAITNQVPFITTLGIYHDDPKTTPLAELRSDACLHVNDDFVLPEGTPSHFAVGEIPAGEYAKATHMGSYAGLGNAWGLFLGEAIPALGRPLADGPEFELYVNDCSKVPETEVHTDLYARLE
jgi:AraC family transcriptional regulator